MIDIFHNFQNQENGQLNENVYKPSDIDPTIKGNFKNDNHVVEESEGTLIVPNVDSEPNFVSNSTAMTIKNEYQLMTVPDGQYRRSLSEDKKPVILPDCKYVSTESMVSNSLADLKDWKASSNFINSGQSNVSSKFGGSTFSITRHKKIDLSAYDEERTETNTETKEKSVVAKSNSYDVLEKAAAIVFEQVFR